MADHSEPRTIVMLGTPFHDVTMDETLERIDLIIKRRVPSYVITADLDFATRASSDVELQRILIEAELVLCDSTRLVWTSRLTGHPLRECVSGPELVQGLVERSATEGWRIFLLGDDPDSVDAAGKNLMSRYPGLIVADTLALPSAPLHEFDHAGIAKKIGEAKPDILLVAFGCPKQEQWIHSHYREIGVPCTIGVGITFALLAGKAQRSPHEVERLEPEWIYRVLWEPGRAIARYSKEIRFLIAQVMQERKAIHGNPPESDDDAAPAGSADNVEILFWKGTMLAGTLGQLTAPTYSKPFIIDMSMVSIIDSSGLGYVLRTLRRAWAIGTTGCLAAPSEKVLSVFEMTRLDRVLPVAKNMGNAHEMIKREQAGAFLRPVVSAEEASMLLMLPQRIINDNAQSCATSAVTEWEKRPKLRVLRLDLASTSFIDSSGLGFLIRCQRMVADRPNARMELLHVPENVHNVLKVSKLDKLLCLSN